VVNVWTVFASVKNSILFYVKKESGKEVFKPKKNEDTKYKNQNS